MHRITFLAGACAGYIAGAAAGRQRYEQISAMAGKVMSHPMVQSRTEQAKASAAGLASTAKDRVTSTITERRSSAPTSDRTAADSVYIVDVTEERVATGTGPTTGTDDRMGL